MKLWQLVVLGIVTGGVTPAVAAPIDETGLVYASVATGEPAGRGPYDSAASQVLLHLSTNTDLYEGPDAGPATFMRTAASTIREQQQVRSKTQPQIKRRRVRRTPTPPKPGFKLRQIQTGVIRVEQLNNKYPDN